MIKSERSIQTLALALATACFAPAAEASLNSSSSQYQISNGGLEAFSVQIDSTTINNVLAGGIQINNGSFYYTTVCSDIEGTLNLGLSYGYVMQSFNGQSGIAPTWGDGPADGSAAKAIQNAAYIFYTDGQLNSAGISGSQTDEAALQLAVWAALYNTTANGSVTGNRFTVNGGSDLAAIALAGQWISEIPSSFTAYTGYLLSPTLNPNPDSQAPQELLIADPPPPVPESPTVIAGALLLLPFAASTFRILYNRRRKGFTPISSPTKD
ncbi:MAG: hypothetical protein ABSE16_00860 [Verrucomicrobiota bacterium]|jgi:hypothetical protein